MSRHLPIRSCLCFAAATLASWGVALAAEQTPQAAPSGAPPVERVLAREVSDELGRQYWVRGGTATNQVFCGATDFPRVSCEAGYFGPLNSERFTIEAVSTTHPASREDAWYRVRFDSGKTGYLNANTLHSQMFVEMRRQDARADAAQPVYELFFNERPEYALARMKQRSVERQPDAARIEQQRFERGGVRVGMTRQQVLNSGWGQPDRVHSFPAGLRRNEQWVYGTSNLYFEDGVLTSVQTR